MLDAHVVQVSFHTLAFLVAEETDTEGLKCGWHVGFVLALLQFFLHLVWLSAILESGDTYIFLLQGLVQVTKEIGGLVGDRFEDGRLR